MDLQLIGLYTDALKKGYSLKERCRYSAGPAELI